MIGDFRIDHIGMGSCMDMIWCIVEEESNLVGNQIRSMGLELFRQLVFVLVLLLVELADFLVLLALQGQAVVVVGLVWFVQHYFELEPAVLAVVGVVAGTEAAVVGVVAGIDLAEAVGVAEIQGRTKIRLKKIINIHQIWAQVNSSLPVLLEQHQIHCWGLSLGSYCMDHTNCMDCKDCMDKQILSPGSLAE